MHWFCLHWKKKKNCYVCVIFCTTQRAHHFNFLARKWHCRICINLLLVLFGVPTDVIRFECDFKRSLSSVNCNEISFFLSLCVVVDRTKLCAVWKNQNVTLFKWEFRLCKMKRPLCLNVVRLSQAQLFFLFSFLFITLYRYAVRSIHGGKWLFGIARQK